MKVFYPAICTHDEKKGVFTARFPDIPGCGASGRSMEETARKARESLAAAILEIREKGLPFPMSSDEKTLKKKHLSCCVCAFCVDMDAYQAYKEYKVKRADTQSAVWKASARKGRQGFLARVLGLH